MTVEKFSGERFPSIFQPRRDMLRAKARWSHLLGTRIAALRREAGLSQAQLAQRLKISPSAMGMYEQGRREPSVELLIALARELGVSMDFLLTGAPGLREQAELDEILRRRIQAADRNLENRKGRPLSRQDLAELFTAMLAELM